MVGWAVPPDEREFVLGDLEEQFRARAERVGRRRALMWYLVEGVRAVWPMGTERMRGRGGMMTGLGQDLVGALRLLRRSPGLSAAVVLTMAVGVGGATAVFSVVRGVVLTPLPFDEPERVVVLWGQTPHYPRAPLTVGDHNELVQGVEGFQAVAASWGNSGLILGEGASEQVSVGWVTPSYFDVVGVTPAAGRLLEEGTEGGIVLTHDLWVRRYGADPGLVGRTVRIGGESFEVVGVLPADADPNLTTFAGARSDFDVWRLMPPGWTEGDDRSVGWLRSTAKLRPGVTVEQAQAQVDALMAEVNRSVTDRDGGTDLRVNVVPARADLVGEVSRTLWILLAAVLGVLLVAASNVAHLLLGRAEMRRAEVAVRAALGGSRGRLVRQFLVESLVLAMAGCALGVGLAWVGIQLLPELAPPGLPRLETVRLDGAVLAFALVATGVAAVLFGLLPALRATGRDLTAEFGDRRSTEGRDRSLFSRGLVVVQVAMSLALLAGTGLLLQSLAGLTAVELGYDRTHALTFQIQLPDWGESHPEAAATMTAILDRIETVPGVERAALTNRVPLGGGLYTGAWRSQAMAAQEVDPREASFRFVTPAYFETLGARLLSGRAFTASDSADVVILDGTAAEAAWPGQDPVGRRIEVTDIGQDPRWARVVGVVAPMRHARVDEPPAETVFRPIYPAANGQNFVYAIARTTGSPLALVEPLGAAVRAIDADAALSRVQTLEALFDEDVAATRFTTTLLVLFGLIALVLAAVGLHGVMAWSVRRRARATGIRLVLGAEQGRLLRQVVASGVGLVLAGIALGTVAALALGRLLASVLYETAPTDPPTLAAAAGLMLLVGLLSSYLPARPILRADPAETLREG